MLDDSGILRLRMEFISESFRLSRSYIMVFDYRYTAVGRSFFSPPHGADSDRTGAQRSVFYGKFACERNLLS